VRIIARRRLDAFAKEHPSVLAALTAWRLRVKGAQWRSMGDIQLAFPKAKVLNADRVRFAIQGGDFRLIAAFDFSRQIAFIKFIGTHAEYDRIDALTVSRF
jgi:mRNA interferase HigB